MSEAQASSEPLAQSTDQAALAQAPAQVDIAADTALILAALGRLEAAVRDGREVLARLRVCLDEMATAIVRAKAIADSPSALSLLNAFEHRIEAMIQIAGGGEDRQPAAAKPPAAEAAVSDRDEAKAEPTEVPTVSGVVSRLGASDEGSPSAADTPDSDLVDVSNVAKLTAMVQALRDSMPPQEPEAVAASEPVSSPQPDEPAASTAAATGPLPNDSAASFPVEAGSEPQPAAPSEPDAPTVSTARFNTAASLPPPEFVSMPIKPVIEPPQDPPPAPADPVQPAHDPLRALKAMSENERLALFS
jgi:hypothetical protein